MRRQLPSCALKKADGFDACKIAKGFIFLFGCPRTAQLAREKVHLPVRCCLVPSSGSSFVFFCSPVTRLLLRFAQTLASDIAVAKDQEEACHCLLPPHLTPPSSLHGVWAQMSRLEFPLPATPFMERLLSKGRRLTTYGDGVALFCHPPPPHTQSSGL